MNVTYFPGCSLDGVAREYGESTEAVARILDIELKELDDWNCCGAASAHVTNDMLALALPARNLRIAEQTGMDLMVPCPACYSKLKAAEKELLAGKDTMGVSDKYQGNFHIKHITDFLWEDVGDEVIREKVKKPLKGLSLVCYYGCLITRPPKVSDAKDPENPESMDDLMKNIGADVKNWSYKTDCCGGDHVLTLPKVAWKLMQKLFDMAEEAGADSIAAACPLCQSNLDSHQKEISQEMGKEYNVPIFYFTELMGLAFGDPSVEKWLSRHMVDPKPLLRQKGLI